MYPSSLTDQEWSMISSYFSYGKYGNRAKHDKRLLVDAILYITKTGCQWRQLPTNFPPWQTVYSFFRRAKEKNIWEKVLEELVSRSRLAMGRSNRAKLRYYLIAKALKQLEPQKNVASMGGKNVKGRQGHIVTD